MSVYIAYATLNELGKNIGGSAESQFCIKPWYNKPWIAIFRPENVKVAEKVASTMEAICNNHHIKISKENRTSLYEEAAKVDWNINDIQNDCYTDATAVIAVCLRACGSIVPAQINFSNIEKHLIKNNFYQKLLEGKYLTSSQYLKRGDILLGERCAVVVLSNGTSFIKNNDKILNSRFIGREISNGIVTSTIEVKNGSADKFTSYGKLENNMEVKILEILSNGWLKIVWPTSQAGYAYIKNENIKIESPINNIKSVLVKYNIKVHSPEKVRKGPGEKFGVAKLLPRGIYTIIQEQENWGYLQSGNGWIDLNSVEKED